MGLDDDIIGLVSQYVLEETGIGQQLASQQN